MEILGYALAICIGLALGLLGTGGSILAIPILVYCFDIPAFQATTYSLFIVGITSLVGTVKAHAEKQFHLPSFLYLGLSSVVSIFIMRYAVMPAIPDVLGYIGHIPLYKNSVILISFACIMICTSYTMIRSKVYIHSTIHSQLNFIFIGFVIGIISGFVGVGGGFLMVPTLVLIANLPMKQASGTSLAIIALNSLIGFMGSVSHTAIQWSFLFQFTAIAVFGIFLGLFMARYISNHRLKPAFGWFVLCIGVFILLEEIFLK